MEDLTITSTVQLADGNQMPRFGLGVYESEGEECYNAVKWALEAGYRHIDSAEWYENEEVCGRAIRDFIALSNVKRDEIWYTTKLKDNRTYEQNLAALEKSLKVCGLGYINLYLIHGPQPTKEARLAAWKACQEGVKRGWVKSVGVSNFGTHHVDEIIAAGGTPKCTVNQIDLHPFMRRHELVTTQTSKAYGIVMEAWGPLSRGHRLSHPSVLALAKKHSRTPAQILLRWGLQMGFVVIPKSVKKERIEENKGVFGWSLDAEDMKSLDGLDEHLVTDWDPSGDAWL